MSARVQDAIAAAVFLLVVLTGQVSWTRHRVGISKYGEYKKVKCDQLGLIIVIFLILTVIAFVTIAIFIPKRISVIEILVSGLTVKNTYHNL